MKKIFITWAACLIVTNIYACDLCSIYLNLEPNDLKNSFGMNYRNRLFSNNISTFSSLSNTNKHGEGNTVISETTKQQEVFNTVDVFANFFIGEKWLLNMNLSFSDNQYLEDDSLIYSIGGIGDASVIVKYLLNNSKVTDSSKFTNRIIVGGGIKLPSGSYNEKYTVLPSSNEKGTVFYGDPYEELDPHLQAGTGSVDFILLSEYLLRYKYLGFSLNTSYRINTTNSNEFRFANRLNLNSSLFAVFDFKNLSSAPNIGIAFENSNRDQLSNISYLNSGGSALFLNIGHKLYYKDIALGILYFKPLKQNLNDNQLQNSERTTIDLTYYFN